MKAHQMVFRASAETTWNVHAPVVPGLHENPTVVFRNGSVVRFRTTNQGPEALAGATIDYVSIDEPTDLDIYRELDKRVMRRSGSIGITLTPINRPCGWLREMVEMGSITEVHARLTPLNLTPHGRPRPLTL